MIKLLKADNSKLLLIIILSVLILISLVGMGMMQFRVDVDSKDEGNKSEENNTSTVDSVNDENTDNGSSNNIIFDTEVSQGAMINQESVSEQDVVEATESLDALQNTTEEQQMLQNCENELFTVLSQLYLEEDKEFSDLEGTKEKLYELYGLSKDSIFWEEAHGDYRYQNQVETINIYPSYFDDNAVTGEHILHFIAVCDVKVQWGTEPVICFADLSSSGTISNLQLYHGYSQN